MSFPCSSPPFFLLFLLFVSARATQLEGFMDSISGMVPDAKKADPVLGVDCGECEDVVETFVKTYPCPDSDVSDGDGSSSADPGEDIHCTFKCTMLCTDDEESCIKRKKMCKSGQKGIDTSKSLFKCALVCFCFCFCFVCCCCCLLFYGIGVLLQFASMFSKHVLT